MFAGKIQQPLIHHSTPCGITPQNILDLFRLFGCKHFKGMLVFQKCLVPGLVGHIFLRNFLDALLFFKSIHDSPR